jgi:hypothetical protein
MDLALIQKRVMKQQGWTDIKAEAAVREYRRFWIMRRKHNDMRLVPSLDVDEIWHAHILFTEKYMEDSDKAFGYYFHHAPSDDDELSSSADKQDYNNVLQLYKEDFGERPNSIWLSGNNAACPGCGSSCGAKCKSKPNMTMADSCSMAMYFGASTNTCLWLESWHVTNGVQFFGSVVAIVALCFLREWITAYRQKRFNDRARFAREQKQTLLDPASGKVNTRQAVAPPSAIEVLVESTFYSVNVTLAYLLMLLIMTYNVGICLAVILGLFAGNFIFTFIYSRNSPVKPAEADHCCDGAENY